MTLNERIERWLRRSNWAHYRGNYKLSAYCVRRAKRLTVARQTEGQAA